MSIIHARKVSGCQQRRSGKIERASWATDDAAGAYGSPLKLVIANMRFTYNGAIGIPGGGPGGFYWSSTVDIDGGSRHLGFGSDRAYVASTVRATGLSVRCIKD